MINLKPEWIVKHKDPAVLYGSLALAAFAFGLYLGVKIAAPVNVVSPVPHAFIVDLEIKCNDFIPAKGLKPIMRKITACGKLAQWAATRIEK